MTPFHPATSPRSLTKLAAAIAIAMVSTVATVSPVHAQSQAQDKYPSRPLTIIIPFGVGSATDIGARLVAGKLQPKFGHPVLVEARPGAGATIGPGVVARAKPDGYTILLGSTSALSTAPGMVKNLPYDPVRDFSGITIVGEQYFGLLTRAEFKGVPFTQFLERMRKEPDKYPVGGQSGSYQTLNNMMREAAKLTHTWVPYAEAGRMMNDLWGGRLGGVMVSLNLIFPHLKSGQGHVMALSATERSAALPDTPLMQDTLPGVYINSWTGYFAPAKTPRPIISTLHTLLTDVGRDPEMLKRNSEAGRALFLTPDETDAYVKKEVPRWTALLKAAGIEPE